MLAAERRAAILAVLSSAASVRIGELARRFNVSEMTVRRDIDSLHADGSLTRVHGGAVGKLAATALEPGFAAKSQEHLGEKRAIAAAAVGLLQPGMSVSVTAGTTTALLSERLLAVGDLTVLTNSLPLAAGLNIPGSHIRVLLTGGERTASEALVGPLALASIRALHVDICLMGVHGIDPDAGLSTPNLAEAETNAAFIRHAASLAVLADESKFGTVSLAAIAPLQAVQTLVTSARPQGPGYKDIPLILATDEQDRT